MTLPACARTPQMRGVVRQVATMFPTAIISGRGREKVESFVGLKELFYAGSHGMDIRGPESATLVSACALYGTRVCGQGSVRAAGACIVEACSAFCI